MNLRKIAIFTSGRNTALRALVRTAIYNKLKVVGIYRGFEGDFIDLDERLPVIDVLSI